MGINDEAPLTDHERELFDALVAPVAQARTPWYRRLRLRRDAAARPSFGPRSRTMARLAVAGSLVLLIPMLRLGVPLAFYDALVGTSAAYLLASHRPPPQASSLLRRLVARMQRIGNALRAP